MNAVDLLRGQFRRAHQLLEATLYDIPPASIHFSPDGRALPIGGHFGHVVIVEDSFLSLFVTSRPPLCASSWSGRTGFASLPPESGPWDEWARNLHVDLPVARTYAQAVFDRTDQILSGMTEQQLQHPLDLSLVGLGPQSVEFLLSMLIENTLLHCGEISCVKGLQGLRGYPD